MPHGSHARSCSLLSPLLLMSLVHTSILAFHAKVLEQNYYLMRRITAILVKHFCTFFLHHCEILYDVLISIECESVLVDIFVGICILKLDSYFTRHQEICFLIWQEGIIFQKDILYSKKNPIAYLQETTTHAGCHFWDADKQRDCIA